MGNRVPPLQSAHDMSESTNQRICWSKRSGALSRIMEGGKTVKKLFKDVIESFRSGVEQEQQTIARRRENAITTMHLTDTLESLTGNRDINPPLKMAIRLMAAGIDPLDFETIDRISRAYSQGKFEFNPMDDASFQTALDTIGKEETKQ